MSGLLKLISFLSSKKNANASAYPNKTTNVATKATTLEIAYLNLRKLRAEIDEVYEDLLLFVEHKPPRQLRDEYQAKWSVYNQRLFEFYEMAEMRLISDELPTIDTPKINMMLLLIDCESQKMHKELVLELDPIISCMISNEVPPHDNLHAILDKVSNASNAVDVLRLQSVAYVCEFIIKTDPTAEPAITGISEKIQSLCPAKSSKKSV